MLTIFFLFWSFLSTAQQFEYHLEGSFETRPSLQDPTPTTINYSIYWNETENELQGLYQDNVLTLNRPQFLSGSKSQEGRKLNIILPTETYRIRQILLSTPESEPLSGVVSLSIITKDSVGATIDNLSTTGILSYTPSPTAPGATDQRGCEIGFGALTRMCGLYDGSFLKIFDSRNRCNLVGNLNPRLELAPDTFFRLYLNYVPGLVSNEVHVIGAFLPSPTSTSIQVSTRNCGPLPGTSFVSGNCKTLSLSGIFYDQVSTISFNGTYSIIDEVNGDTCTYSLHLRRE
jgi:hypothetical protein